MKDLAERARKRARQLAEELVPIENLLAVAFIAGAAQQSVAP